MPANPFHYGTPAGPEHFTGRVAELTGLTTRMADGINVVLLSPRRYGKTSLLLRAEEEVRAAGGAVVHVNILRCRDLDDLAGKLAGAAYLVPEGRWHRARNAMAEFAKRLRVAPSISIGPDGSPTFTFTPALGAAGSEGVIADVYRLLADERPKRAAVLALDEFQAVTDLGSHLPGLLKSLADQFPSVSLVVAGSRAHLMERLTGSSGAPLYGMAERFTLGEIDDQDMSRYLQERAATGGKPMSAEVAHLIMGQAGPVPNNIQRLAYAAYAAADGPIGAPEVARAMADTVSHDAATFADLYSRLSGGQRRVLLGLCAAPGTEIYSANFARAVGLATAASVRKAIEALAGDDQLVRRDGRWAIADPFFAAWLADLLTGDGAL